MLGYPGNLIADPLGFARQWELGKLIERTEFESIGLIPLAVKRVLGQDLGQQGIEPFELPSLQGIAAS
jgi:hypothetical protein